MGQSAPEHSVFYPAYIAPLTSLRFLAAVAVYCYHFSVFFKIPQGYMTWLLSKGYLGVDFFFILSGFILTHVYAPRWREGNFSMRHFLICRLARIYPVHFLTLILAGAIGVADVNGWMVTTSWPSFFANLFLVQSWGNSSAFSFNLPAWSLSAEWFAYLCFPFLLPLVIKVEAVRLLLYALIFYAGIVLVTHILFNSDLTDFKVFFCMFRIMPEFFLGMALCRLSLLHPWRAPGVIICGLFTLTGVALYAHVPDFICILLLAVIIYAAAGSSLREGGGLLSKPLMVYLGKISYGFYMLNALILFTVWAIIPVFDEVGFWMGIVFLMIISAAVVLHHFFEVPARRLLLRQYREA